MMKIGESMKTKLTKAQIIELIDTRQDEAIELERIFKKLGNQKMADMYAGEIMACSTLLYRIGGGK